MEYDWYADLFFLEEVYRDVLILWLAAVLMRRRAEALRLLGAGIAGGLCSTGSVYLELMGRCLQADSRYFWDMGSLETAGDRIFEDLDQLFRENRPCARRKGMLLQIAEIPG